MHFRLKEEEKFNHCQLDTPKMGRVFLLLLVLQNTQTSQAGIHVGLNIIPAMTRAIVTVVRHCDDDDDDDLGCTDRDVPQ